MSARGGRGNRRGRRRGSGGDGQPPPQDFSKDQSNVPVHDLWYSFAYFNPNQLQGRGTPSQPLGIQAADARKNDKTKIKMMWSFIKHHASGPSNEPPPNILSSHDEDSGDGASPDGDDQGGAVGDASAAFDPFAEAKDSAAPGAKEYVHIRIQQRNGKKSLTTVQGLRKDFSYEKILKDLKKEFCCNGNVVQDKELGKIIQLQGDQRRNVANFLVQAGLVKKDHIKIHGF
ncbi:hypothetical protein Cgig2_026781 [Carnegiea gigantea]|uniref:SUI1 domain-containing protein n=1 Tax=Carnegiea gigantea TaxID=171969 RepID=A0A9Q1JLA8_9CARY|nr:hypothetical protein Cgig2_026781 [Carnegiea gigantea]